MTLYECVLPSSTGFHFNNYYFEQNKTRQHKQHSANKTLLRRDQMNIEQKIVSFGSSFELVCMTFYNMCGKQFRTFEKFLKSSNVQTKTYIIWMINIKLQSKSVLINLKILGCKIIIAQNSPNQNSDEWLVLTNFVHALFMFTKQNKYTRKSRMFFLHFTF